jgi:broad specificity phosphatase PhoE
VLFLVRHGESVGNAQGLLLGRADAELTALGLRQAASVRHLLQLPVAEVRTSPLRRARHTAEQLRLGLPVTVDERWVEVDYGEFDGRPLSDVPAEVWQRWMHDPGFRPEGGESLVEVEARVVEACSELFAEAGAGARRRDEDVVVVSHVTPIKTAVAWALGVGDLSFRLHLRTGSVSRIGWGAHGPVLHGFNEVWPASETGPIADTDPAETDPADTDPADTDPADTDPADLAPGARQPSQSPGA